MRKTDVLKTCPRSKFLGNKNCGKALAFKNKKVQGIFGETFIFCIIASSCLLSTKPCLRLFLICFPREIKSFYQNSLGDKIDFKNIMNGSLKYLGQN